MTYPLILELSILPIERVRGIYTIKGVAARMPPRALYLWPPAAAAFLDGPDELCDLVVVSDIFRSPESSLEARRTGRGAKAPGFSAHNFGLAIDLDIEDSLKRGGFKSKEDLDIFLESKGFYCYRRDHRITDLLGESHHFNFLGPYADISSKVTSTAGYVETRIFDLYGESFTLSNHDAQRALAKLGLYHGDMDGLIGPISRQAIGVFQRGWGLADNRTLDAKTTRTLAYVASERNIVPVP